MIKRLKWNVFHGGGGGEESDGGLTSSDDSDAGDTAAANEVLAQLIANDPELRAKRGRVTLESVVGTGSSEDENVTGKGAGDKLASAGSRVRQRRSRAEKRRLAALEDDSSDEEELSIGDDLVDEVCVAPLVSDSDEELVEELYGENGQGEDELSVADGSDNEGGKGALLEGEGDGANGVSTWKECTLCSGKHFLNDREVTDHLQSKGHARALKRFDNAQKERQKGFAKRRRSANDSGSEFERDSPLEKDQDSTTDDEARKGSKVCSTNTHGTNARNSVGADVASDSMLPKSGASGTQRKAQARKAAVKKKLKAKKQRKWEREQASLKVDKSLGNEARSAESKQAMERKGKAHRSGDPDIVNAKKGVVKKRQATPTNSSMAKAASAKSKKRKTTLA